MTAEASRLARLEEENSVLRREEEAVREELHQIQTDVMSRVQQAGTQANCSDESNNKNP